MPITRTEPVADLSLDIENFRTVKQSTQEAAADALIAANPPWFWALTESLLEGYLPTESILVMKVEGAKPVFVVKEGNRRIAALKLIHGFLKIATPIRDDVAAKIKTLPKAWKSENRTVPCVIYEAEDAETVDRIVTLVHGKGDQASRDPWNTVARARHSRDMLGQSEPGLDVLEKYIKDGQNLTPADAATWGSQYPSTILDEALRKLARRLGFRNAPQLAEAYPAVALRDALDRIAHDIGKKTLSFEDVRATNFGLSYGIPAGDENILANSSDGARLGSSQLSTQVSSGGKTGSTHEEKSAQKSGVSRKHNATAINDPATVRRELRKFSPKGDGGDKLVDLRNEAINLDLKRNPLAFCFLLRSMFEISADAYYKRHTKTGALHAVDNAGNDKPLRTKLGEITKHLTGAQADPALKRALNAASQELTSKTGILSVRSMNQLVHHPNFLISTDAVCQRLAHVFPLLKEMNA